jgi:hypothetical protein
MVVWMAALKTYSVIDELLVLGCRHQDVLGS